MSYPENYNDWPERIWVGVGVECRVNMGLAGEFRGKRLTGYTFRECESSPEMEYVRADLYNDSVALEDAVRHHYANEAMYYGILKQVADGELWDNALKEDRRFDDLVDDLPWPSSH